MWKSFIYEDKVFMLKLDENSSDYEIFLTNLGKIWSCKLSKDEISQKFQVCNSAIEMKPEDALTQTLKLLSEIDTAEVLIIFLHSTAKLNLISSLSEFTESKIKIKYILELAELENDLFKKTFSIPLLQTVMFLEKQQNMMKNLLLKKDRELEEYQMEKGVISRSDLITDKFEPEILISSSNKLMINVFGKIENQITRTYGEIENKIEDGVESWNNVKKKRKIYSKETAAKAKTTKIIYEGSKIIKQE